MRLFLFGGTGFIGSRVIEEAGSAGCTVDALVRSDAGASRVRNLGAVAVRGDLARCDTWVSVAAEASAWIDLIQPAIPRRITRKAIERIAVERLVATGQILTALDSLPRDRRPLLLSVSGTDDLVSPPRGFAHIGLPVRRRIEASGVDATFVHLGTVYGAGKTFAERILPGLARGRFPIPGAGDNRFPIVHVVDAARALVHLAGRERTGTTGRSYTVVDQSNLTLADMFHRIAQRLGAPEPRHVPLWLAQLFAGSVAVETLTRDLQVDAADLLATGFEFRYPQFDSGIQETLRELRYEVESA